MMDYLFLGYVGYLDLYLLETLDQKVDGISYRY